MNVVRWVTNATIFKAQMKKWAEETVPSRHTAFHRRVAKRLWKKVLDRSPVAFGELRAGWAIGVNALPPRPVTGFDRTGSTTQAKGNATIERSPTFSTLVFANYTPQANIVEHGKFVPQSPGPSRRGHPPGRRVGEVLVSGGFSTQAPRGVIRISLEEVEREFSRE